jgi:WD40 repeat protein
MLRTTEGLSEVHTLEHDKPVRSLAFSPGGRYLTAGGRNGTVFFIDTANDFAQVDRYVHAGNTINNEVTELAYSPDGRYLVSGTRFGEKNQLKIMRIEGGE